MENSRHRSTNVLDVIGVLVSHLAKQEGDHILVLVSEGFIDDSRMMNRKRIVMDAALRSHVVVNALSVGGVGFSFPRLILSNVMTEASSATGGRFITNTNDLTGGLSTLASAPEASYLLELSGRPPRCQIPYAQGRAYGAEGVSRRIEAGLLRRAAAPADADDAAAHRPRRALARTDAESPPSSTSTPR